MSSPRKPPDAPQIMGWLEMLSELKKIYDYVATIIPDQMKSYMKIWQEKIDELKPMIENIKAIAEVLDPEKSELKIRIEKFTTMLGETMAKGKGLSAAFTTPKLYYVHDKAQAKAIQPSSAVVIYRNSKTQQLYLRGPDSYVPLTSWSFSPHTITHLGWLSNAEYPVTCNADGEVIGQPGTNMAKLTSTLKKAAGVEVSLKQQLTEIVSMGQDIGFFNEPT